MAHNRSALNADKEMRRLFGGNAAAAGGRGARAQRRGGRGGGREHGPQTAWQKKQHRHATGPLAVCAALRRWYGGQQCG